MTLGSTVVRFTSLMLMTLVLAAAGTVAAEEPLLRFPDIHGDTVVFVCGEDIWTAPASGGRALRLTDDEGEDRQPKFSPDGSMIAFTSKMDGNNDVYVMRSDGSDVRRLTFHPGLDEVVGWHPTSNKVMFASSRAGFARRLYLIATDGTGLEELPLHEAGRGDVSPDGTLLAYNRVAREDRTWKRYHGGMAQDLWLYEFDGAKDRRLTDYDGTDRLPMWIGDSIYFASDRDGALNIYSYNLGDGAIQRITRHEEWDARRPSSDGVRIVYELGSDIWLLDPASGETAPIAIHIPVPAREAHPYRKNVAGDITHLDVSPQGGRALICARGEVFTVPREHGPTRNLTGSPGSRETNAAWSPDGTQVAFISDADGESDIWITAADGSGEPRRLTDLGAGYRHTLRWAPDGSRIAFADQTLAFFVLEVATGTITEVDRSEREPMDVQLELKPISDFAWSPDSRWLAYSKIGEDMVSKVWLYELASGTSTCVSTDLFNDFGPVFTRDGRHLLFISNRRFNPTFGDFEWEMVYKKMAGIYAITLAADGGPLLPLRSDEVAPAGAAGGNGAPGSDEPVTVKVDLDGLSARIQALPVPRGNYRRLAAAEGSILFLNGDEGDYNAFEFRELGPQRLESFDLSAREVSTVVERTEHYALSTDGKTVAWQLGKQAGIMPVAGGTKANGSLDMDGVEMVIDPRAEWLQVYNEAWRMERDFFYTPEMHGLDWKAVGDKYRSLVLRATCAQDMRFIIGELIGELSTSHTYVRTGDTQRRGKRVAVGMLGADWKAEDGRWRITKIYRVPDWSRDIVPPLAAPGVEVHEGDFLLAVNGTEVTTDHEVYAAFQGLADAQVQLTVGPRADGAGSRNVVVEPMGNEFRLRYHDWVENNRRIVDEASGGRIGYIHLPDTYVGSATEFAKTYYSQTTKQGLIIDGRFNGGGLDPDIFLNRLAKQPLSYWTRRYSSDHVTPWYVSPAKMVCLTNRQAGSGGDELPYSFREKGMGPVIGTRTWGGLVGVSMSLDLMDGSSLTAPDYRIYSADGRWVVENEGVTPDIIVERDPAEMARGWDAQLHKGIEVLLEQIEADPYVPPTHPPFPKRR